MDVYDFMSHEANEKQEHLKLCNVCEEEKELYKFEKTGNSNHRRSVCISCRGNYKYIKNRNDIQHKLKRNLRSRVRSALKNNQKTGSAIKDLGCSVEFLKEYLESKFRPGMSWDNYGPNGWHIDHIKPLGSFDLTKKVSS